jgi:hypothetical protein
LSILAHSVRRIAPSAERIAFCKARREVESSGETKNSNIKIVDNDAFSRLARLVENSA